jgi:hypothetical protein
MTKASNEEQINNANVLLCDVVVKKAKIGGAITTLSRLQIQLMSVGISNEDYNDISEMIGDIKERLANIA